MNWRTRNAWWLHQAAWTHRKSCKCRFVDFGRHELGCDVHGFAMFVSRHIDHELAGVGCVSDAVLSCPSSWIGICRKHYVRRIVAEIVELAVRREIDNSIATHR